MSTAEAEIIPLLRGNAETLSKAGREELLGMYDHYRAMGREWFRRFLFENNRVDILAEEILGYDVKPFHRALLAFQAAHPDSLQLCYRGSGKSTLLTVAFTIFLLAQNRELRILICSKTQGQAEAFLKEIKGHLEENEKLIDLFGPFYDPQKVNKWDNKEIEVLGKKKRTKEGSVTCVGVGGMVVGKHYDVILSDDLVDEDNSRTKHMRDLTRTWYYQTLDPCLEPPDAEVPHRGEHHRVGTRYHFDDLYGHLMSNELKEHTQIIPALDEKERSPWPEKHPPEWFKEKKRKAGTIIFNAQFLCDTEAMKGEIFQYDDCQTVDEDEIPGGLRIYCGADLAISEKEKADLFAMVALGIDPRTLKIYILDYFEGHLRFNDQTKKILQWYKLYKPIRFGIETNAYQLAQYQNLKDEDQEIRLKKVNTEKDKIARAWKLSAIFEDKRVFFRKGLDKLKDALVLFPSFRYKDGFDAFDIAYRASKMKRKRKSGRRKEPGVI
jgi:phage terminase large subunit-like protein